MVVREPVDVEGAVLAAIEAVVGEGVTAVVPVVTLPVLVPAVAELYHFYLELEWGWRGRWG